MVSEHEVDEDLQKDLNTEEEVCGRNEVKIMEPAMTFSKDRDVVGGRILKNERNTRD